MGKGFGADRVVPMLRTEDSVDQFEILRFA
jgi:hypothetical protein